MFLIDLLLPIRSTTQICVMHHQHGISAVFSEMLFLIKTSVGVTKCCLFSQITSYHTDLIFNDAACCMAAAESRVLDKIVLRGCPTLGSKRDLFPIRSWRHMCKCGLYSKETNASGCLTEAWNGRCKVVWMELWWKRYAFVASSVLQMDWSATFSHFLVLILVYQEVRCKVFMTKCVFSHWMTV